MSTKNKILLFLLVGILIRIIFWIARFTFYDTDTLSHMRYTEKFMNFEIPELGWIGARDQLGYSMEAYPPFINLIAASFAVLVEHTFLFDFGPKITTLVFSIMILLVAAIFSLRVKNPHIMGLVSIMPLEWFHVIPNFNNDIAVAFFISMAFLVSLRKITLKSTILISLFTSLALLSKYTAVIFALAVAIYLGLNSRNLKFVLIFIAMTTLIASPWYARNLLLYGDPLFIPSLRHTAEYFYTVGIGPIIDHYIRGFYPICNLGYAEDFIMLYEIPFILFFIIRGLETKFKHMITSRGVELVTLFLPILVINWIAVRYIYPDVASGKYLVAAILPFSIVISSGINATFGAKEKYPFLFIYLGFIIAFISVLANNC